MNSCAVCNAPSTKQCAACLRVFYCSKEHQKQDWKNHKTNTCLPYKIKEDATLGRHVVAARQLAAGDLVLKENLSFSGTSTTSSMEHSCMANCYKVNNFGEIIVRAAQPIAPGEHLSLCYTDPALCTRGRLYFLLKEFNSTCNCTRCLDPTELGTHFSSLKCQMTGCNGLLVPPDNNLISGMPWKCQRCHKKKSASNVSDLILSFYAAFSSLDKTNLAECQDLINFFEQFMHENHYLLTEVRIAATKIPNGSTFTEDEWRIQLKYCRQLDQIFSKLALAHNDIRCYNLFRICAALLKLNGADNDEEAKQVAAKAYDLLKHEPNQLSVILTIHRLQMGPTFPMSAASH